ncbi:hypothetical protein EC32303_4430 [Escherichia coli 3.2303]|nr:hypothetical protein EC32303_4430 [Escherichia coli 3.2303]EKI27279.1 hypothetical protein ECTW00353_2398 [Escherichia coli TW00353]EKI27458.1 hypothetical protein ECTW15901_5083 [Escherichia coli TW15901]
MPVFLCFFCDIPVFICAWFCMCRSYMFWLCVRQDWRGSKAVLQLH